MNRLLPSNTQKQTPQYQQKSTLQVIDPLTLAAHELAFYKEAKKNAFMAYHQSPTKQEKIIFSTQQYYAAFTQTIKTFNHNPSCSFMLSAKDSVTGQVQGGLFGQYVTLPALATFPTQTWATVTYLFVEPHAQHQGIGTALMHFFITHTQGYPSILAVRHAHAVACRLYEKCGFTLITEQDNPMGHGSQAVRTLLTGPGYFPEEFVAYWRV